MSETDKYFFQNPTTGTAMVLRSGDDLLPEVVICDPDEADDHDVEDAAAMTAAVRREETLRGAAHVLLAQFSADDIFS